MPKQATGELRTLADGFAARITIEGRNRKDFFLAACPGEDEARARCTALAELAARLRKSGHQAEIEPLVTMGAKARAGRPWEAVCAAVDALCAGETRLKATAALTMEEWARRWTSGELARQFKDHIREKRSADRDEELLRQYVLPHVKDVRVDEFALADAEFVMASIPEVSSRTKRPLRQGTRRHIAQTMARLMNLAVYPGKVRKDNPIPRRWLPRVDDALAKECLYPDEESLLLGGRLVGERGSRSTLTEVPLLRRLAYGFLAREGMRVDELSALRWADVDLRRGRVTLDENKTDDPRDWDLQPDVVEVLAWWKARQGEHAKPADARVFAEEGVPLPCLHLADLIREDLIRVGVTRPQLFERSNVRQPFRAHDLRATFVTVALATGRTETWISDRTGHHSHEMVEKYRRKARTWNLGPLVPFTEALPEMAKPAARPQRLPHGLPHPATIPVNIQRAQRKPMPQAGDDKTSTAEETRRIEDPGKPEIGPVDHAEGQSRGNPERLAELEAAIANVTRLLGKTDDAETAAELVAERKAMRTELAALREAEARASGKVRAIDEAKGRR